MLLRNYVIDSYVTLHTRGVHEKSGGFVNAGGWGTRKLAYTFHAAYTRRDKNMRHAWECNQSDILSLLMYMGWNCMG